jgi:hypothetical protein
MSVLPKSRDLGGAWELSSNDSFCQSKPQSEADAIDQIVKSIMTPIIMLYAAIANKLDLWLWIGYGFVSLEGIILLTFKFVCPLTLIARKYSNSTMDNFAIYLPDWLSKYTFLIYTTIVAIVLIITIYQILN